VAFTALAGITLIVAALLLLTGEPKVSLVASRQPGAAHLPSSPSVSVLPGPGGQVHANTAAPVEWILLVGAIVALGFAVWLWANWSRSRPPVAPA
jgi:hypothetical protein